MIDDDDDDADDSLASDGNSDVEVIEEVDNDLVVVLEENVEEDALNELRWE